MNQFNYNEEPEVLKHALRLFKTKVRSTKQFDGSFQYGRVQGIFYSNTIFDAGKLISLIDIKGKYKLNEGTMSLNFSRSYLLNVISSIGLAFGVLGTISTIYSQEIQVYAITSLVLGFALALLYQILYHFLRNEFIWNIENSIKLAKDKIESTKPSETQNTDPTPLHSTREV